MNNKQINRSNTIKNKKKWYINSIMVFATLAVLSITNLYPESTGFAALDMPTSAMSASTMGVFVSEPGNAMNLFENPVGICCNATNINFTNNFWFADVNQSVLTFGKHSKFGTFGAGLNFVSSPGIEVRSRPTDEPEGKIDAHYLVAALGYSKKIITNINMGFNVNYLYESLYSEDASGFAFDVAAMWQMPSNLHLTMGLHNLGSMSNLKSEASALPSSFEVGLVRPKLLGNEGSYNGALGIFFDHNIVADETEIKVGAEISLYEKLFFRGGYSIQKQFNDMSFGSGISVKKFKLDFAMILMEEIPDYPYVFTFSYEL